MEVTINFRAEQKRIYSKSHIIRFFYLNLSWVILKTILKWSTMFMLSETLSLTCRYFFVFEIFFLIFSIHRSKNIFEDYKKSYYELMGWQAILNLWIWKNLSFRVSSEFFRAILELCTWILLMEETLIVIRSATAIILKIPLNRLDVVWNQGQ